MPSGSGRPARRVIGLLLAAAATLLGACTSNTETDPEVANAGYEAVDSTYTWWDAAEREDPIDLAGTTFEGDQIDLAQWRGGITVLNFWYAACPPCRAEAPDLAELLHRV